MTLSRFLRDYLYIPLGGNRKGPARRYVNLIATMLLGGLWHGAGWTFVIWGALHGIYLIVDHAVCALGRALGIAWRAWMRPFTQGATLLAVVVGWVFFRATSLDGALRVLQAMGRFDAAPGDAVAREYPNALLALAGSDWAWVAALLALALFAPNSQQIIGWAEERWKGRVTAEGQASWRLAPLAFTGFATTLLLFLVSISGMRHGLSPFIYFNF